MVVCPFMFFSSQLCISLEIFPTSFIAFYTSTVTVCCYWLNILDFVIITSVQMS